MPALFVLLFGCLACAHHQVAASATAPAAPASVSDEMLELRVGATAAVPGTTSALAFVRVSNDSRCPKGVTCVWEGDAVVELRVQTPGGEPRVVSLHVNPRFEQRATIDRVVVALDRLEPYPEADRPIPADGYVVTLRVTAS